MASSCDRRLVIEEDADPIGAIAGEIPAKARGTDPGFHLPAMTA